MVHREIQKLSFKDIGLLVLSDMPAIFCAQTPTTKHFFGATYSFDAKYLLLT